MDGKKSEAVKKIELAKQMIADNDYAGARSKLLEVHYQSPSLISNLPQMITACDILCASELTLSDGETDWYWVLQLSPLATISEVRLQHSKLTTLLEGIKDEFPGSIAALKFVHDAFLVLSNMPKRIVFDSKRFTSWGVSELLASPVSSFDNMGSHSDKNLIQDQYQSALCESSDSKNIDVTKVSSTFDERSSTLVDVELNKSDELLLEDDELRNSDDAHDETYNVDERNEGVSFSEANTNPSSSKSTCDEDLQVPDNNVDLSIEDTSFSVLSSTPIQRSGGGFYDFDTIRKVEDFTVGQIWAAYDNEKLPRRYARINGILKSPFRLGITWLRPVPKNVHERKWCDVGLPVVCGLFDLQGDEEESLVEHTIFSHLVSYSANPTYDQFEIYPKEQEIWATYKNWTPFDWCENPESRKGCPLEMVRILDQGHPDKDGVMVEGLVKVNGSWNIYKRKTENGWESCFDIPSRCMYRFSHRVPSYEFQGGETTGIPSEMFELDPLAINASFPNFSSNQVSLSSPSSRDSRGNSLKLQWSVGDFGPGQVWAIYDGSDLMPRRYVLVNNVIPNGEIIVTYLDPHPVYDEEISWIEENLPFGCGTFKVGSTTMTLQMSRFSHLVDSYPCANKKIFYRVYPRKGEVWAMYRNWSSKWKKRDFGNYRCRIVEIITDFNEDSGVQTTSLEEVPGYKTFYQRQLCEGFGLNRTVPRSEMLSFSHRVEAFVVPGIQTHGIPECSWHLEPDALPPVLAN